MKSLDDVDYEEANYVHTLMELHGYVVRYGRGRVLDDLQRLIAASEQPWEPYGEPPSAGPTWRYDGIDQEEQLSYDPRNFGPDRE
jgi:hypothetical protein